MIGNVGKGFDFFGVGKYRFDFIGYCLQLLYKLCGFSAADCSVCLGKAYCKGINNGELGGICLGRCNCNFPAGLGQNNVFALLSYRAVFNIDYADNLCSFFLSYSHGGKRVCCFTALADDYNKRLFVKMRVHIAKFRCDNCLRMTFKEPFAGVCADCADMVS